MNEDKSDADASGNDSDDEARDYFDGKKNQVTSEDENSDDEALRYFDKKSKDEKNNKQINWLREQAENKILPNIEHLGLKDSEIIKNNVWHIISSPRMSPRDEQCIYSLLMIITIEETVVKLRNQENNLLQKNKSNSEITKQINQPTNNLDSKAQIETINPVPFVEIPRNLANTNLPDNEINKNQLNNPSHESRLFGNSPFLIKSRKRKRDDETQDQQKKDKANDDVSSNAKRPKT